MTNIFSSWLISILGISLIGIITDFVLPNGKMKGVVKTSIAIFSILIIIKPIKNFDLNSINFNLSNFQIDSSFVENNDKQKINSLISNIENNLNEMGYKNIKIELNLSKNNSIETIYVDLSRLVLNDNALNINKYTNIMATIKQFVNIQEDDVIFYE